MTIKASVHNHCILLPADAQIADGTEVEVIVPEATAPAKPGPAMAWMAEFMGAATTLPPDAAARHDELAHGRKRKSS